MPRFADPKNVGGQSGEFGLKLGVVETTQSFNMPNIDYAGFSAAFGAGGGVSLGDVGFGHTEVITSFKF